MTRQRLSELLDAFVAAWNAHDPAALMACMVPGGGTFHASAGPAPDGVTYDGKKAVRTAYEAILTAFPDAEWHDAAHIIDGDRAVTTWRFTATRPDGSRVDVRGCDVFKLHDGLLAVKDTFRKHIV